MINELLILLLSFGISVLNDLNFCSDCDAVVK